LYEDADRSEARAASYLSGKVAVIVTHVRGLGPSNHLEAYLVQRSHKVLSIDHPLVYEVPAYSQYRLFVDGALVDSGEHLLKGSEVAAFFQEVVLTIYWVRKLAPKCDLFYGVDALNCIAGIIARAIGLTKKTVFYVIDWSPKRFEGRILNDIYHLSDRFAALFATETWNQSNAIDRGRWRGALWSQMGKYAQRRVRIVPNAVAQVDSEIVNGTRLPYRLVFLGHLLEKQGLQCAIKALPKIAESFKDVDLVVVGSGPYLHVLQELAFKVGVSDRVRFLGYVADEDEVIRLLASASCGLAPYLESEDSYTYFSDPGKLKNYLAAGLPIVMTRVPHNAEELEEIGCAILVDGTADGIAGGVCSVLNEDELARASRRETAIKFIRGFDWESVFAHAVTPVDGK
jgi:glycosyltransferase involved in cell wall biosynthesis